MSQVSLYVNEIVSAGSWTQVGTTPYLDTQNYPTSYIHSNSRNANSDVYGFTNSSDLGTINWVKLWVYCQHGGDIADFATIINSTDVGLTPGVALGWVSVDISAVLTTWDAINAATMYFDKPNTANDPKVDAAYIQVDYTESVSDVDVPDPYEEVSIEENITCNLQPAGIDIYDEVTLEEDTTEEISAGPTIEPSVDDGITLEEATTAGIEIPDTSIFDASELEEYISIELNDLSINVYDITTATDKVPIYTTFFDTKVDITISEDKNINVYDEISVSEDIIPSTSDLAPAVYTEIGITEYVSSIMSDLVSSVYDEVSLEEDSVGTISDLIITTSDELGITESVIADVSIADILVYDEVSLEEDKTVSILAANDLEIGVYSSITIEESVISTVNIPGINIADNITVSESTPVVIGEVSLLFVEVNDSISLNEDISAVLSDLGIVSYDIITIQEHVVGDIQLYLNIFDATTLAEVVSANIDVTVSISDSINIEEYITCSLITNFLNIVTYDLVSTTEVVSGTVSDIYLTTYDIISVSDNASIYWRIANGLITITFESLAYNIEVEVMQPDVSYTVLQASITGEVI